MADQQDDDALFDRLAKSLEAVRYDAELARSGGVAGITASVTRAEAELHRIGAEVAELRRRMDAQERAAAAGGGAGAQSAAELRALRESVELLSRRVEAHEARLAVRERSRSWPVGRIVPVLVLLVVILVGAVAWAGFGLRPTPREMADRFTTRVAELAGFQPPPRIEPAPVAAVPAPAESSGPAVPGSSATSVVAPGSPPDSAAASVASAPAPVSPATPGPAAAVPAPATGPAPGPAPSSAATAAAVASPAVTTPPAAAPSAPASETASAGQAPATPAGETPTPITSQTIDAASQAPAGVSPPQPAHQALLRATADSWVEIRQKGGRTLLRRTMRPGETWAIPADPNLLLNSGNAAGLELVVDGVPTRLAPAKSGMVHDLPLDPDSIAAAARPHP